jgi:hypothetical protein
VIVQEIRRNKKLKKKTMMEIEYDNKNYI